MYSCLPLRVESVSGGVNAKQFVGVGDGVQVGSLSVEEVRVRFPDLVQHLDARTQFRDVVLRIERQPIVFPHLTEVAVHGKHLSHSVHYRLLARFSNRVLVLFTQINSILALRHVIVG